VLLAQPGKLPRIYRSSSPHQPRIPLATVSYCTYLLRLACGRVGIEDTQRVPQSAFHRNANTTRPRQSTPQIEILSVQRAARRRSTRPSASPSLVLPALAVSSAGCISHIHCNGVPTITARPLESTKRRFAHRRRRLPAASTRTSHACRHAPR
jgi:hypothetical protein